MARRDLKITKRRIKKAEKKLNKLKASSSMRSEIIQWTNLAENRYQEIVQIKKVVHTLFSAVQSLSDQVDELISTWLAKNDDV